MQAIIPERYVAGVLRALVVSNMRPTRPTPSAAASCATR